MCMCVCMWLGHNFGTILEAARSWLQKTKSLPHHHPGVHACKKALPVCAFANVGRVGCRVQPRKRLAFMAIIACLDDDAKRVRVRQWPVRVRGKVFKRNNSIVF